MNRPKNITRKHINANCLLQDKMRFLKRKFALIDFKVVYCVFKKTTKILKFYFSYFTYLKKAHFNYEMQSTKQY